MSRIFISHSSANNAAALAMGEWLSENGWNDVFLDVSPAHGLAPGERWQEALKAAADRCEAVIFLVTPAWRDSRWCLAEFLLAKQLGKVIFGVIVEATPLETLPPEMTTEWQICDLVGGTDRENFRVLLDPVVPETEVSFARVGLDRLRLGLQKAGLDASTFPWPPKDDPKRPPYPGLRALEAEDAAVFFGRDAAIVRGLDALRGLRERGVERMLVILGASGAGKSSFLRAGLWPRLARDDRHFLPLPVIRPERAAISGATGLVASLDQAFRGRDAPRNRADIRKALQEPGGLSQLLVELQARTRPGIQLEEPPPTVVFAIDQGEELFGAEGRTEAEQLLARVAETLAPPLTEDAEAIEARRRALVIVVMRSDSYEQLQTEPRLAQVRPQLFDLPPIKRTQYKAVIDGPASRATAAGRKLEIDPHLTERLLEDAEGADALPLLAFTLERLFVEHGADGDLRLHEYEELGGVRGSIEAAINAAFSEPGRAPAIPADHPERLRCLREGFIPWLARVDPDTEERRRRVAEWDEIPDNARPLFDRLVEARLLKRDRRRVAGVEETTTVLEIAHEALLRQWPMLTSWLDEDADDLKALGALLRASEEWERNGWGDEWLVHKGGRLVTAEALRRRGDFKRMLSDQGESYLKACRKREEEELSRKRRQLRRTRIALAATMVFAIVALTELGLVNVERRKTQEALAGSEFQAATREWADARCPQSLAHLARTLRLSPKHSAARHYAVGILMVAGPVRFELRHEFRVNSAAFSPDGARIVTASTDGRVRFWHPTTGQPLGEPLRHEGPVLTASYSPDGAHLLTVCEDGPRTWNAVTAEPLGVPFPFEGDCMAASFSPSGKRLLTVSEKGAQLWDATTGLPLGKPLQHGTVIAASFSPDGARIVTASTDETARVWHPTTGQPLGEPLRHEGAVWSALFSPDGTRIVTTSTDETARVWDARTGRLLGTLPHKAQVDIASFSRDGTRLVTGSRDGKAQVWNARTGHPLGEPLHHGGRVRSACFSRDGRRLLTAARDVALVWDPPTGQPLGAPLRHESPVISASFRPDGTRVVTVSEQGARVWNASSGRPSPIPLYYTGSFMSSCFVALDRTWQFRVVTTSEGGTAQVWDATMGRTLGEPLRHGGEIVYAIFSPSCNRILTASRNGTARVWDAKTGEPLGKPMVSVGKIATASFNSDGTRVVTGSSDKKAQIWDARTGRPLGKPLGYARRSASFSPDGTRVVTASGNTEARLWDARTGRPLGEPLTHDDIVLSASFSPDGTRVVTGSWNGEARLWDARTGRPLGEPLTHADYLLSSASFSPDGTRVVTTTLFDRTVRVWDATTSQPLGKPLLHDDFVRSASFSPDGARVVTISSSGTAWVWDVFGGGRDESTHLASLAEAVGGYRINELGAIVPLADRDSKLQSLRRQASKAKPHEIHPIEILTRWFFADPWTRTISPLSKLTVPEYICDCLRHGAYDHAQRDFAGHPLLRGGPDAPLPAECAASEP